MAGRLNLTVGHIVMPDLALSESDIVALISQHSHLNDTGQFDDRGLIVQSDLDAVLANTLMCWPVE
jgi:hypothetical protein